MRWTKEHWAKLNEEERSILMSLLKGLHKPSFYGGFNMPEDIYCCGCCGEPIQFCNCYEILERLTAKMGVPMPDI